VGGIEQIVFRPTRNSQVMKVRKASFPSGKNPRSSIPCMERGPFLSFMQSKINIRLAARLFAEGKSYKKISNVVGVTRQAVFYALRNEGLWQPRLKSDKRSSPRIDYAKVVEMYQAGKSVPAIALAFGYKPGAGQNRVRYALIQARVYKWANPDRHHGMSATPEYISYCGAKARCTNPNREDWPDYGGRGIKFLFASFKDFYAEVGPRPAGMTLDRINHNGHYEQGNVRWANATEQSNNRRTRK
jgi:hypothetical protein